VVAMAAGLKKAIGHPYDDVGTWVGLELAVGVALFVAADAGFRHTLGISRSATRLIAAALALATIPIGTQLSAAGQVGALAAIVSVAIAAEGSRRGRGTQQS